MRKALRMLLALAAVLLAVLAYRTGRSKGTHYIPEQSFRRSNESSTGSTARSVGVRVLGQVVNASSSAVSGALVYHQDPDGTWTRLECPTDDQGRFSLTLDAKGIHTFYAKDGGQFSFVRVADLARIALAPDQVADLPLLLRLKQAVTWRVQVHGKGLGEAIQGAEISLPRLLGESQFTDAQGYVDLVLPQDVWELQVSASGYRPQTLRLGPQDVTSNNLDVVLERGSDLSGRVIDEHGLGVSEAVLTLGHGSWSQRIFSDRLGYFQATGLPEGQSSLMLRREGFRPRYIADFSWQTQAAGLVFVLQREKRPQSQISGQVQDLFGLPLADAKITLLDGPYKEIYEAASNQQGQFQMTLPPLEPDDIYSLLVRAQGQAPRIVPFQPVHGSVAVTAVMEQGKTLSGTVTDAFNQALANAKVAVYLDLEGLSFLLSEQLTDNQGRYFLNDLDGKLRLQISAPGYLNTELTAHQNNDTSLDVQLEQQGWLMGQIRDTVTHLPVRKFKLWLESYDPPAAKGVSSSSLQPESSTNAVAFSSQDGSFLLPGPVTGSLCKIRIEAPSYPSKRLLVTSLAQRGTQIEVFELDTRGRSVRGKVVSAGQSLKGARITALVIKEKREWNPPWEAYFQKKPDPQIQYRTETTSAADGSFSISGLSRDGDVDLIVECPGYGLLHLPAVFSDGSPKTELRLEGEQVIRLEREAKITCSFSRTRFPDAMFLELRGMLTPQLQKRVLLSPDKDQVSFVGLPPGSYSLDLSSCDDQGARVTLASQWADVNVGQYLVINAADESSYRVWGDVAIGDQSEGLRLYLMPRDKGQRRLKTLAGPQGKFVFPYVSPGDYELIVLSAEPVHHDDVQAILDEHPNRINLVVGGNQELHPRFPPMGSIRGFAGNQAVGWAIQVRGIDGKGHSYFRQAIPDGSGYFAFFHLPPGNYSVDAQVGERTLVLVPLVPLAQGGTVDLGKINYQVPGKLQAQIVGDKDQLGAVQISAFPENQDSPSQALAERIYARSQAMLELPTLLPGPVTVKTTIHNEAAVIWPSYQECRILPGQTTTLTLRVVPVTRLDLTLLSHSSGVSEVRFVHIKTGNMVRCQRREQLLGNPIDLTARACFNNAGAIADNLDSGLWQIEVERASGAVQIVMVELVPGTVSRVTL